MDGGHGFVIGKAVLPGQILHSGIHIVKAVGCHNLVGGTAGFAVIHIGADFKVLGIQDGVRIRADGKVVSARLQDVAAMGGFQAGGIIGGQILQGNRHGNLLGSTGLQHFGLFKVHQIDGGLFNAAVGIRRREVQLHHILALHIAGVLHGDFHGEGIVILLEVGDFLGKAGVAQAVAKGILDILVIINQPLLCGGLIELVAHVDALHIIGEGEHALEAQIIPANLFHQVAGFGVDVIAGVAGMVVGGSLGQILQVGIHGLAGGVDRTIQNLTKGGHTGGAGTGNQQDSADVVIFINPIQLHGIIGIDNYDNIFKMGANHVNQVFLGAGQLQIVLARLEVVIVAIVFVGTGGVAVVPFELGVHHIGLCHVIGAVDDGVHVGGQVGVLAAAAANDHHGGVGEGSGGAEHFIGVSGAGGFGQRPILAVHGNGGTLLAVFQVKLCQVVVHLKSGIPQRQQHTGGLHGITGIAGACTGIDGVHGSPAKHIELVVLRRQGEQAVVLHQNHALVTHLGDDLFGVAHHVVGHLCLGGIQKAGHDGVHGAIANEIDHQQHHQHPGNGGSPADHMAIALLGAMGNNHHHNHGKQGTQNHINISAQGG